MKKVFFVFLALLSFAQCTQPEPVAPSADFHLTIENATHVERAPLKVRVRAVEAGATYLWHTTGIAPDASSEAISILFQIGGTHKVRLSVTKNGVTTTSEQQIVVKPAFTAVRITKITLSSFPATKPNGSAWDALSGSDARADVYPEVTSGTNLIAQGGVIMNALPTVPCAWNDQITIGNQYLASPVLVTYYDSDSPAREVIGGISFTPRNFVTEQESMRYPTTISGGATVPTILNLSWIE